MVSAIAASAVLVVVGLLLFQAMSRLKSTETRLKKHTRDLEGYYKKEPFPSPENVQRERANTAEIDKRFEELMELAREGQFRIEQLPSPATFNGILGGRKSQFASYAERYGVGLPADFNFGFDRYFEEGGSLASPDHVPRLMEQLVIVQNLWMVLCQEGISDISRMQRDEFEGSSTHGRAGAALTARAKNAGVIGEDDLFASFHFVLEFRAREQALVKILNRLAAHKLFIVATNLDIQKSGVDIKPSAAAEEAEESESGEDKPEFPPLLQRTVSGLPVEAPMRITLELDVYKFREKEGGA